MGEKERIISLSIEAVIGGYRGVADFETSSGVEVVFTNSTQVKEFLDNHMPPHINTLPYAGV